MAIVLCNAGPLIALGKLNRLDLLAGLFAEVQMPRAVYEEVIVQGLVRGEPDAVIARLFWERQGWPVVDVGQAVLSAYVPPVVLYPGETEVLALARSSDEPLVLMDDEVARSEARRLGLDLCSTLGILMRAYHRHLLSLQQVELLIHEIEARPDIWISTRLCIQVLGALRVFPLP